MSLCPFHYHEHRSDDAELIGRFIDTFPLALITSNDADEHYSSHIPLLREADGTLFGHADRRNPQFAQPVIEARLFFLGPDVYVPPEGYLNPQLPTWNYLAVHMQARIEVLHNPEHNLQVLQRSAEGFARGRSVYQVDPLDPRVTANIGHIVSLHVRPVSAQARFKLSQNKGAADQAAALEWFLEATAGRHRPLLTDLLAHTTSSTEA